MKQSSYPLAGTTRPVLPPARARSFALAHPSSVLCRDIRRCNQHPRQRRNLGRKRRAFFFYRGVLLLICVEPALHRSPGLAAFVKWAIYWHSPALRECPCDHSTLSVRRCCNEPFVLSSVTDVVSTERAVISIRSAGQHFYCATPSMARTPSFLHCRGRRVLLTGAACLALTERRRAGCA